MSEPDELPTIQLLQDEMELDDAAFAMLLESSTDDEEEPRQWGGSEPGRAPNKERDFHGAYEQVTRNYFNSRQSKYNEVDFERRFRVSRNIFNRVHDCLMGQDPFIMKEDTSNRRVFIRW